MQTFLPYIGDPRDPMEIYEESAGLLDQQRLGKQRVENLQIMQTLVSGSRYLNHPAVKMWRGHEWSLLQYQKAICEEWIHNFGFKDTCLVKTMAVYFRHSDGHDNHAPPPWLGDPDFHRAHQSNLLRKDPAYYGKWFPGVPDDLPYIWPVK